MTDGSGRKALTELVVTIVPPRSSRWGTAARVTRTAARKLMVSVQVQSSSLTERKPPVRGRTAPTLLTRMSSPPKTEIAASTSRKGPSGVVRSTKTGSTGKPAASRDRSSHRSRAAATTLTPSSARAWVTARPIPLLAKVTTAVFPVRYRSMISAYAGELAGAADLLGGTARPEVQLNRTPLGRASRARTPTVLGMALCSPCRTVVPPCQDDGGIVVMPLGRASVHAAGGFGDEVGDRAGARQTSARP
jgi:hypothetical protein